MKNRKFIYLSVTPDNAIGIRKKIQGFSAAFVNMGMSCRHIIEKKTSNLLKKIIHAKDNYELIFIRYYSPKVLFIIIFLRIYYGSRIILDLPTPLQIGINEERNFVKKIILFAAYLFTSPLINILCYKVLMYGPESKYFQYFTNNKIINVTNGYNVSKINFNDSLSNDNKTIKLVGVAAIADWHGFDRVIRSMKNSINKIEFNIIGNGPELGSLKKLVNSNNLNKFVKFHGNLQGKELEDIYYKSDIGIATCAGFRKNINKASDLKSREYVNYGIPFISSVDDDDFVGCNFVFKVLNDESLINLDKIIGSFHSRKLTNDRALINKYAVENLSFNSKVKKILDLCY